MTDFSDRLRALGAESVGGFFYLNRVLVARSTHVGVLLMPEGEAALAAKPLPQVEDAPKPKAAKAAKAPAKPKEAPADLPSLTDLDDLLGE